MIHDCVVKGDEYFIHAVHRRPMGFSTSILSNNKNKHYDDNVFLKNKTKNAWFIGKISYQWVKTNPGIKKKKQ